MKKILGIVLTIFALLSGRFASAATPFSIVFENDFVSRYVWRGFEYTQGPAMQPDLQLVYGGLKGEVWSNFVLNNEPNQGQFSEVDYSLEYGFSWKSLTVTPSFEMYTFPSQVNTPSTGEIDLLLEYALGPVTLATSHNFDVVHYGGSYFGDFEVGFEHELTPWLSLETAVGLGWGNAKFNQVNGGGTGAALNYFSWKLGFPVTWGKYITLTPHMEVRELIHRDLRAAAPSPDLVWGGLLFSLNIPVIPGDEP